MATQNDTAPEQKTFAAQEIAYRVPGQAWKRKTVKTEKAFEKAIEQLTERGAEIRVRDAE